jgi:hypothetical protein
MKKTILCHFRDEEYLLPWWLNHHKQIFDDGILIDYHSTDRSVEIIKEICPNWTVVTSRNPNFQADNVDYEVMDIERGIEGWRICLNVTEFLIGDYSLLDDRPLGHQLLIPSLFFVDCEKDKKVVPNVPLWEQKRHGFDFIEHFHERRARSIHNVPVQYPVPGRHYGVFNTTDLVVFYFGWAPVDEETLSRKLQIQSQIPLIDRQRNWGFHHVTSREVLEYRLEHEFVPKSRDLSKDIERYERAHRQSLSNLL